MLKKSLDALVNLDVDMKIAKQAYELYERQGRREGHAAQDWPQAERNVREDEPPN